MYVWILVILVSLSDHTVGAYSSQWDTESACKTQQEAVVTKDANEPAAEGRVDVAICYKVKTI